MISAHCSELRWSRRSGALAGRAKSLWALSGAVLALATVPLLAAAPPAVTRLDPIVAVGELRPMSPFAVPGRQVPRGGARELVAAESSGMRIGVWEGEPGILQMQNYSHDEYCLVLIGELIITGDGARSQTFHMGESFFIPKGFSGRWDMKTKVRTQYVMVAPPDQKPTSSK